MGYLRDMYGYRSKEFVDGVIAGLTCHAFWYDGEQFVGTMRTPLHIAIDNAKRELLENYDPEENKK